MKKWKWNEYELTTFPPPHKQASNYETDKEKPESLVYEMVMATTKPLENSKFNLDYCN